MRNEQLYAIMQLKDSIHALSTKFNIYDGNEVLEEENPLHYHSKATRSTRINIFIDTETI